MESSGLLTRADNTYEVDEIRAIFCLDEARRRAVETGPGVEDDRTPGLVMILLGFGSGQTFQQPRNKVMRKNNIYTFSISHIQTLYFYNLFS